MTDNLNDYDWQITCECTHRHTCTNPATHVAYVHAIDHCDQPDLDAWGNRPLIRCQQCIDNLRNEIKIKLLSLLPFGRPPCATCNAHLIHVGDIVRKVTPLKPHKQ